MLTLGVLDQSPIRLNTSASAAIHETVALAQVADKLGYQRYWLAEHHNSQAFASSAPEVLIPIIAQSTTRIRVGSGGIMLTHYSPFKVAETFRMLYTLFPGRIDLGIGRAPGGDNLATMALGQGSTHTEEDSFPQKVKDLLGFIGNTLPQGHPYEHVRTMPDGSGTPEVWFLGSSERGALHAASLGLAFCFAQFFNGLCMPFVLTNYRQHFLPSPHLDSPRASLAVRVMCAETAEDANRLASSFWLWQWHMSQGQNNTLSPPDEAVHVCKSERVQNFIRANAFMMISGDPQQVKIRLIRLAEIYGVDELLILTTCHDAQARLHSYELIATIFDLPSV